MRNLVAKNDFNRAAVHLDRSKEPQVSVEEGLEEHYIEVNERPSGNTPEQIAWEEYKARCDQVRASGESSVLFDLQRMESALQEEHHTIPPGLTREEKRQFIISKASK